MKQKIKNQIRQGDVMITPTNDIPTKLTPLPREGNKVILAHGEVTGHHHALLEPGVEMLRGETDAERFLTVETGATLTHQEHAIIPISRTTKPRKIVRQREFSDELSRKVTD